MTTQLSIPFEEPRTADVLTLEEAKAMYPTSHDWQFEPLIGISVGARVNWKNYQGEIMEGTVAKFWYMHGNKIAAQKDGRKPDLDNAVARIHLDDGDTTWKKIWDISKIKITTPETATGGEG